MLSSASSDSDTVLETRPDSPQHVDKNAGRALLAGILCLVGVYAGLFAFGSRFLIAKTAVMPIFVLYAVFVRRRAAFLTDWLPLLAGLMLFDALRGAIFNAVRHSHLSIFPQYTITLEKLIFRTPAAPLVLQQFRTRWLDLAAVVVHASHFAFFLLFGLILWHLRPAYFPQFRRALLLVMGLGLFGYAAVPSVPPWLAYRVYHLLPPIEHVVADVYTVYVGELYGTFDTNPVAAMPSLHAAFPTMCVLMAFVAYGRRVGAILSLYAMIVIFAVIYLGEHYAVDVAAGVVVAAIAIQAGRRPWARSFSFVQSLAVSCALLGVTLAILIEFP